MEGTLCSAGVGGRHWVTNYAISKIIGIRSAHKTVVKNVIIGLIHRNGLRVVSSLSPIGKYRLGQALRDTWPAN